MTGSEPRPRIFGSSAPTGEPGWVESAAAGGVAFLVLVTVGAVILFAAKLADPSLGWAGRPLGPVGAMVVFGLTCLGVPLMVGGFKIVAIPLSALAVIGWGLSSAASLAVTRRRVATATAALRAGARVGAVFGIVCGLAAVIFRSGSASAPAAGASAALALGVLWGLVFGCTGAVLAYRRRSGGREIGSSGIAGRWQAVRPGVVAGAWMLVVAGCLAVGTLFLWILWYWVHGAPWALSGRETFASALLGVAFLPNVAVCIISLGLGAPIRIGAHIGFGGRIVGSVGSFSLLHPAAAGLPRYGLLLLLIPASSCIAGGFIARRGAREGRVAESAVAWSVTFAGVLATLGRLGQVRVDAPLMRTHGSAGAEMPAMFLLSVLWTVVAGAIGWYIAQVYPGKGIRR